MTRSKQKYLNLIFWENWSENEFFMGVPHRQDVHPVHHERILRIERTQKRKDVALMMKTSSTVRSGPILLRKWKSSSGIRDLINKHGDGFCLSHWMRFARSNPLVQNLEMEDLCWSWEFNNRAIESPSWLWAQQMDYQRAHTIKGDSELEGPGVRLWRKQCFMKRCPKIGCVAICAAIAARSMKAREVSAV